MEYVIVEDLFRSVYGILWTADIWVGQTEVENRHVVIEKC